jgi:hypothetical protein
MPETTYTTAQTRRTVPIETPVAASPVALRGPALKNAKTSRTQTVVTSKNDAAKRAAAKRAAEKKAARQKAEAARRAAAGRAAKSPVAATQRYAVSPLPLDSTQIEQIDAMRRAANEAILSARAGYDEGVATAELENQMAAQGLRRQTAVAARDMATRAGSRGMGLSPAVIQRGAADIQSQADRGFADIAGTRASRLAELTRRLQQARGSYDTDMNLAARLEARYGANPRGLMGVG